MLLGGKQRNGEVQGRDDLAGDYICVGSRGSSGRFGVDRLGSMVDFD